MSVNITNRHLDVLIQESLQHSLGAGMKNDVMALSGNRAGVTAWHIPRFEDSGVGSFDEYTGQLKEIMESDDPYVWLENEDGSVTPVDKQSYLDAISFSPDGRRMYGPAWALRPLAEDQSRTLSDEPLPPYEEEPTGHHIELSDGTLINMTPSQMNDYLYGRLEGDYVGKLDMDAESDLTVVEVSDSSLEESIKQATMSDDHRRLLEELSSSEDREVPAERHGVLESFDMDSLRAAAQTLEETVFGSGATLDDIALDMSGGLKPFGMA